MNALAICRAALRHGNLVLSGQNGGFWLFGQRRFHPGTVNALIDAGEAIRLGDCVVRWSPQR